MGRRAYFERDVRPLLTPIGLDPAHPFPQVVNKSLNFIVELAGHDAFGRETSIAIVKAPRVLPRLMKLPPAVSGNDHCVRDAVVGDPCPSGHACSPGAASSSYAQFRVTRDADLWIDEEEVKNLRQALQGELGQRQFGAAVRLEVPTNCPEHLARSCCSSSSSPRTTSTAATGRSTSCGWSSLIDQVDDCDELKWPSRSCPGLPARAATTRRTSSPRSASSDVLLHHPYQSFEPVVEFIRRAADDPDVVAIKQTVYRTGVNSVLMEALIEAARSRQGGHRRHRTDGALRRGGEHQLGGAARAGRRAGRLRRVRAEDARQARAGAAPGDATGSGRARLVRTRTSAPATTIRGRRACTPTSGC